MSDQDVKSEDDFDFNLNDFLIFFKNCIVLYCLYLYPGFYSYTEGATWKILDLLTETLLI